MRVLFKCVDDPEKYFLYDALYNYRTDLINKFRPQLFEIFMGVFKNEIHRCNLSNDQYGLKIYTDDCRSVNVKFYVKSLDIHFTKIPNIDFIQRLIITEIRSLLSNNNLDFVPEIYHLNDSFVWVKIYLFKQIGV